MEFKTLFHWFLIFVLRSTFCMVARVSRHNGLIKSLTKSIWWNWFWTKHLDFPDWWSWPLLVNLFLALQPLTGHGCNSYLIIQSFNFMATFTIDNSENSWIVGASTDSMGRSTVLERIGNDSLILTLALPSVSPEDSGQYLCSPSNMAPVTALLHVVIGNFRLLFFFSLST